MFKRPLTLAEVAAYNAATATIPDAPCVRCGCCVLAVPGSDGWCAGCRQTDDYVQFVGTNETLDRLEAQAQENPTVQVNYQTARGAHVTSYMCLNNARLYIQRQKREVTVLLNGAKIGGVEWCTRQHEGRGMKRPHWHWWIEGAPEPPAIRCTCGVPDPSDQCPACRAFDAATIAAHEKRSK